MEVIDSLFRSIDLSVNSRDTHAIMDVLERRIMEYESYVANLRWRCGESYSMITHVPRKQDDLQKRISRARRNRDKLVRKERRLIETIHDKLSADMHDDEDDVLEPISNV